jgi:hypothetical protein
MNNDEDMLLGMFVILLVLSVVIIYFQVSKPNISDADLYRFCMVKNIKINECKIPPFPLEQTK